MNNRHTKNGLITEMYNSYKCLGGETCKGGPPEFRKYILSKNQFHKLFIGWEKSGFALSHRPRVAWMFKDSDRQLSNVTVITGGIPHHENQPTELPWRRILAREWQPGCLG